MAKRYVYVFIIVAILIFVCVWEQLMITNYLSNMQTKITNVISIVEDETDINTTQIYGLVEDLENTWDGYQTALCYLVNLKDVEDIGIELTKMKIYIVENSVTDFKASLSLLLFYIDGYYNLMGISFQNIF
ncbi:MAG: DUF4363 family protein [Clostridia bacterium]|nr:DUF4363 family protein [Clostridia bacterium]